VLQRRSTYNGCKTQTVLYTDEPINLTCTGEKRFDGRTSSVDGYHHHHTQQQQQQQSIRRPSSASLAAVEPPPRRVFMALSNCRSSVGLLLHYRLEIFGNLDPNMCSNAAWSSRRSLPRHVSLLTSSLVIVAVLLAIDSCRLRWIALFSPLYGCVTA